MSSRHTVVLLLALGLLGAPSTAVATPGWTMAQTVSLPANTVGSSANIGYQAGGTETLAYLEITSSSPLATALHVGVVPPGGGYQEQMRIPSSTTLPANLSLAVAPDGAAVLEWLEEEAPPSPSSRVTFLASYRPVGSSTWEAPVTIAREPTHASGINARMVTAISSNGTAAAGLEYYDPTDSPAGYEIEVAVHAPSSAWGASTQISPTSDSSEALVLGFDAVGDLTAAFRQRLSNGRYTLDAVRRPASTGIWDSLEDITSGDVTSEAEGPALGIAPDGSAVIAFQYVHYAAPKTLDVNAVTRSGPNGAWTSVTDVAPGGASSGPLAAGESPDDHAYVLYRFQGESSSQDCVGAVRSLGGGVFSTPQCVSPTGFEPLSGGVTFLSDDAYFAWSGNSEGSSDDVAQGSRWPDGASQPESFTNLDAPTEDLEFRQLVPDQDGSVAAFWTVGATLRAAAYDAGAPILLGAGVPTSAVAGQPTTFTASFFDLWSGLASGQPTWGFGDGSAPVSGASVTHTFAMPGVYTVALTASDALGNATSTTYTVTVSAPPAQTTTTITYPTVTLSEPVCPKKLSKSACKRYRASRKAWQTLNGTVAAPGSSVAGVQVAVFVTHDKTVESLIGKRFRKSTGAKARKVFVSARVKGGHWSLTLPQLKAGIYTIMIRATNRAGEQSATVSKTLKLS